VCIIQVEQLAEKARIDKKTLLRIVHQGKTAHPLTWKKIADALGVAVSAIRS
jgi:hypothetical protein